MRTVLSGTGTNTTSTVQAALRAGSEILLANLYLIGSPDDPAALWLTDWESPLLWSYWGTFQPAVIKHSSISTEVGLDSKSVDLTWSPPPPTYTASVQTTSPYGLALLHYYDHWPVRMWRCLMPTKGDANTWGAYELFGGHVGDTQVERGQIHFTVDSYLDVLDQKVPSGVIEVTNPLASYTGGTPPAGMSVLPTFTVVTASTVNDIYGDCTTPGFVSHIFSTNAFQDGYLVFRKDATLGGLYSVIAQNYNYEDPSHVHHNAFQIFSPMPWTPNPGDVFYVSAHSPIDQADGDYYGFPYVPDPETAG